MEETLGYAIAQKYGQGDPAEINARIGRDLQAPEGRRRVAKALRDEGFANPEDSDEVIAAKAAAKIRPLAQTTAERYRGEQQSKFAAAHEQGVQTAGDIGRAIHEGKRHPDAAIPAMEIVTQTPTPDEVEKPTVHQVDDFNSMVAAQREDPSKRRLVLVGDVVQLQNERGVPLAQLKRGAGIDPSKIEGLTAGGKAFTAFMGPGSYLHKGLVHAARGIYDPVTGKVLGGRDVPVDKSMGLVEYAKAMGGRAGEAFPRATSAAGELGSFYAGKAAGVMGGIDRAEQAAAQTIADVAQNMRKKNLSEGQMAFKGVLESLGGSWAEANKKEAERYEKAEADLARHPSDIAAIKYGLEHPEHGPAAGEAMGESTGEAGQMFVPTEASLFVGGVGKHVVAPAAGKVVRAVGGLMQDRVPGLLGWFKTLPESVALKPGTKNVVKGAQATRLNIGDTLAKDLNDRAVSALQAGLPPEVAMDKGRLDATLREAMEAWGTRELREKASPDAQKAIDILQPFHKEAVLSAGIPLDQYNPFHVLRGQEFTKSNMLERSLGARDLGQTSVSERMPEPNWWKQQPMVAEAGPKTVPGRKNQFAREPGFVHGPVTEEEAARLRTEAFGEEYKGTPGLRALSPGDVSSANLRPGRSVQEIGESVQGVMKERLMPSEVEKLRNDFASVDALTGLVRSARSSIGKGDRGKQAALNVVDKFRSEILKDYPDIMPVEKYAQGLDLQTVPLRSVHGYELQRHSMAKELEHKLAAEDKVLLTVMPEETALMKTTGEPGKAQLILPDVPAAKNMNGLVVPRRVGEALRALSSDRVMQSEAHKVARGLDRLLGMAQAATNVTLANPDFTMRNNVNTALRLVASEGEASAISPELRKAVAAISNATQDDLGQFVLGGRKYTAGELSGIINNMLGVRKGFPAELEKVARVAEAPSIIEAMGAPRLRGALTQAGRFTSAPGRAANQAADTLWKGLYPGLNPHWTADDAMRAHAILAKLRRGVSVPTAVADTKVELLHFGDLSPAMETARLGDLFAVYHWRSAEGALKLAMMHPQRFARVYHVANAIMNADTALHDNQAVSEKFRTPFDRAAGAPIVQTEFDKGRTLELLHPEVMQAEAAQNVANVMQFAGMDMGGVAPQQGGIGAMLTNPVISSVAQFASGNAPNTGRPLVGTPEDQTYFSERAKEAGVPGFLAGTAPAKFLGAYRQQMKQDPSAPELYDQRMSHEPAIQPLGTTSPGVAAAIGATLATPVVSQVIPPWLAAAARIGAGMGGSPFSRTPEMQDEAASRWLQRYLADMRSQMINPAESATRTLKYQVKKAGPNPLKKKQE